jgi:uncharacterized protein YbjT (DUF2867 family)
MTAQAAPAETATTAIVLGASGLVGSELVSVLRASPFYRNVLLLGRRPLGVSHAKIVERVIDFDAPDLEGISEGHLFCALGTTLRKAGSEAAQFRIDCEYPTTIATRLRAQGVQRMILVSSVGASTSASNFYLRTKGQLEANVIALGFESTSILRPSLLLGPRKEFRAGERAASALMKVANPFMVGPLRKYHSIDASTVAASMVQLAQAGAPGVRVVEYEEMCVLV